MPGLRGILKKKENIQELHENEAPHPQTPPDFTFLRTTTLLQEKIEPPDFRDPFIAPLGQTAKHEPAEHHKHVPKQSLFRKLSSAARANESPTRSNSVRQQDGQGDGKDRRSSMLHWSGRSRSKSDATSSYLPQNLEEAPPVPSISIGGGEDQDQRTQQEAQWEKRATVLGTSSTLLDADSRSDTHSRDRSPSISNAQGDVNIQEAIRLHETGDLTNSTRMFGRLADPNGENNALSQVLYGLALRHGWGIEVDPQQAIHYLTLAAQNSASVEEQALQSGMKKGGAAKGELVLAIFELANCLRNGWGVKKDPVAARQYYETAANLGDTDAMSEAAWCLMEGFGGSKDKFKAAQYLRMAEKKGVQSVGNSWIWKDKYNSK